MNKQIMVAAFYKFSWHDGLESKQIKIMDLMRDGNVFGTILLASEGVNGTIAGPAAGVEAILEQLRAWPEFSDLKHKTSWCDELPFRRQKVKIKAEIVTMHEPGLDATVTGELVEPALWNELLARPGICVIDTRNEEEVAQGSFVNALDPKTKKFSEFKEFVSKNLPDKNQEVAMFCTGGVRCEKASSYMLQQGFKKVYQLDGGILNYLEKVSPDQSLWQGACFIFDERGNVDHHLEPLARKLSDGLV